MRSIIIVSLLFFGIKTINSQDYYFSQFYNSPLTLNPALTGVIPGDYRIIANYRNLNTALVPFSTYSVSFDSKFLRGLLEHDVASAGIVAIEDDLAGGAISNLVVMASGAYHFAIGKKKNTFIVLGGQAGIFQRRADLNDFSYPSQWVDGVGYDPNISNQEDFTEMGHIIPDFQAGIFWYSFIGEASSAYAGFSAFHLAEPKETFLGSNDHLPRRYVGHGGARIAASEDISLIPNVIYMNQAGAFHTIFGTHFEYVLSDYTALKIGGWYRWNSSVIASLGFEFYNFSLGLSYDIASNRLTVGEDKGGFEISLIYAAYFRRVVDLKSNPGISF